MSTRAEYTRARIDTLHSSHTGQIGDVIRRDEYIVVVRIGGIERMYGR